MDQWTEQGQDHATLFVQTKVHYKSLDKHKWALYLVLFQILYNIIIILCQNLEENLVEGFQLEQC